MTVLPEPWERPLAQVSMRRRLIRLQGSVATAIVLALIVALLAWSQAAQASKLLEGAYFDALADGDQARLALVDAEPSVRSYYATCSPEVLQPYRRTAADPDLLGLDIDQRILDAHPEVARARERATRSTTAWLDDFARPTVAAIDEARVAALDGREDSEEDREEARAECVEEAELTVPPVTAGRASVARARDDVEEYLEALSEARAVTLAERQSWDAVLVGAIMTLALVVVLLGTLMWLALETWVIKPAAILTRAVRTVAAGSIETEIRPVGAGEIMSLSLHVEGMRRELLHHMEDMRLAQQEVENAHVMLTDQARELERSNRDLEHFAYVASHDLQEPLRKVAGFSQMLQQRYGDSLDDKAHQYIEFAVDGAKRMQELIKDLLSFSRVGRSGEEHAAVDLDEVLGRVEADLSERIAEAGATITHDPLPTVRGEPRLLHQVLANLLSNALKFREPERDPAVHIEVRSMRTAWEISVVDNGIGIEPQYADRVFVIFQRLHPRGEYSGTGIGLALVKRIVEHHGGHIWIEPTEGGGTTVRFTLARTMTSAGGRRTSTERAQSTTLG
ncbi:sensor histidine kinase [Myceligenerans xiligouense]|uniref:histidine kinase n=1 Tax=Myceligenerans xiligouense TaxID=253184 RepID=A0A3N4Z9I9_9MICO|nr:ATP-binding protein [Myceligenerans xiligouense]RPF22062.1 phospho-acceptor domain-containing protein [Myceligenerans xiligouense]